MVRTIRYLGNKRRLVPQIVDAATRVLRPGDTFVDLFAGSCVVGHSMLSDFRVIANDVEHYSYCLGRALIQDSDRKLDSEEAAYLLADYYDRNLSQLSEAFDEFLRKEGELLRKPHAFRRYARFCAGTPYAGGQTTDNWSTEIVTMVERVQGGAVEFPYCLFSTYFMNGYFGVRQCIQIDSIRYAIDQVAGPHGDAKDGALFHKFIAGLIYAASHCVSSPGHFAQYNVPNNRTINAYVLQQRSKDIWALFLAYVEELFSQQCANGRQNRALREDARSLLMPSSPWFALITRSSLVYADPPYTADQYSRFYHVLNTLVLYDYPDCEGKGRYRSDRYVSAFSLKSRAQEEINALLGSAAAAEVPLILSYLDDALVDLGALDQLCRSHFGVVETIEIAYNHSTQGRAPDTCTTRKPRRKEMLYVCLP